LEALRPMCRAEVRRNEDSSDESCEDWKEAKEGQEGSASKASCPCARESSAMDEEIWDFRLVEQGTFLEFLPEHDLRMSRCASAPALLYRGGDGGRVTSEDDHAVPSNLKGVAMDAMVCFERLTTCSTMDDVGDADAVDLPAGMWQPKAESPSASECEVYSMRPSQGSALHSQGLCKPCAWFWRPGSCYRGVDCQHCHLCPPGALREMKRHHRRMAKAFRPKAAGPGPPA